MLILMVAGFIAVVVSSQGLDLGHSTLAAEIMGVGIIVSGVGGMFFGRYRDLAVYLPFGGALFAGGLLARMFLHIA